MKVIFTAPATASTPVMVTGPAKVVEAGEPLLSLLEPDGSLRDTENDELDAVEESEGAAAI